ncbi:MAG TPA: ATP-binding cassette domain-containing protein [Bryobacteraceae bacterium]|nr:ATP-binding cassette domain-containing protein [Bryobacteraceae bacterium]
MHHVVVERWSRAASPLHTLDARAKLGALAAFLIAVSLTPARAQLVFAGYAALLAGAMAAARLPLGGLSRRAALVLPFSATFAVVTWWSGQPLRAAALAEKSFLSGLAGLLLIATTPLTQLLAAVERLRAPRALILAIQFLYRYLFVISEQAQHMRLAARSRSGGNGRRTLQFSAAAGAVGVLFARSAERAGGIYNAMLARGYGQGTSTARPPREGAPVIEVQNLRYRYPDGTQALDGVDFRLEAGECVALLGANGSGKTTFVLHLNGLLEGEGLVEVCGMRVAKENLAAIRAKTGLVFQDSDEQLFMPTVLEDVAFGPANLGLGPEQAAARAKATLEQVRMSGAASKAPYHLSAGEKRRVAIAGVLAMQPEILVLDEPTTFLDPPAQRDLAKLLAGLPQAKVLVTHDVEFARALATRAVFFERGKVAGEGSVDEIIRRFDWLPRFE